MCVGKKEDGETGERRQEQGSTQQAAGLAARHGGAAFQRMKCGWQKWGKGGRAKRGGPLGQRRRGRRRQTRGRGQAGAARLM